MTLTDAIRETLRAKGLSVRRISLDTDITRATIASFLDGSSVNSNTLDRLAEYLGLEVRPKDSASKPAKGKR